MIRPIRLGPGPSQSPLVPVVEWVRFYLFIHHCSFVRPPSPPSPISPLTKQSPSLELCFQVTKVRFLRAPCCGSQNEPATGPLWGCHFVKCW